MKAKKKEFREPETVSGTCWIDVFLNVLAPPLTGNKKFLGKDKIGNIKVRIIRETDYQRLLAAARRRKGK